MHRATLLLALCLLPSASGAAASTIGLPENPSRMEQLAGREVRRYVYLRTGELLPIRQGSSGAQVGGIILARKDRLPPAIARHPRIAAELRDLGAQSYLLHTVDGAAKRVVLVGGDDAGTLYAAYRFAEILGVRFYLHGDVLPDAQIRFSLPDLKERHTPLFPIRGIQPFHDFPEGPDWWNQDDYLAVIGQLPKLGMNFFGLHTYPENRPNAEPTVWIGSPEDARPDGTVSFAYPSSYMSTLRGNWGYAAKRTSDYIFGSASLFERDDYGPEVMFGHMPAPVSAEASIQVFDRAAGLLRTSFSFARELGVKTCVGTETPLVVPKAVQERLRALGKDPADPASVRQLYEGVFRRAASAYPLDYYWFWTPEGWTWSGTKDEEVSATTNDLFAAIAAHNTVKPPFALATCGWVLGPQQDRALFDKVLPKSIAVSCINREVGKTPVEPGFAEVRGRSKWAIPWMEDDPSLTAPQFWVGRMRRDAADALRYGCDGLLGIHWRTRVLSMNVRALAQAAWTQEPWIASYHPDQPAQAPRAFGPVGGAVAGFPDHSIADTDEDAVYQTVRYNVSAYHLPVSNGTATVILKFCEPHYDGPGKRVFDVNLQGRRVISRLDIFAKVGKDRALDYTFRDVAVTNGWVSIEFRTRVEFPSIAGIVVETPGGTLKVNAGGPAVGDYLADPPGAPAPPQVYADTADFYADWAVHEFGPEAGPAAARVFEQVDCRLPTPATWVDGPGGIRPDPRPAAQVAREYQFVEDFAALRPLVKGRGNLARFDYWRNTLEYMRAMAFVNCSWAAFNRALEQVKAEKDGAKQKELARTLALTARTQLVLRLREVFRYLLPTVSNPGELGTVANWNQHLLPDLLAKPGAELERILGEPLPRETSLSESVAATCLIVPTLRGSVRPGESLRLKVIVTGEKPLGEACLRWRKLGSRFFQELRLRHEARDVYSVSLPPATDDFEYYVEVKPAWGPPVVYPASAPVLNQTVVVW